MAHADSHHQSGFQDDVVCFCGRFAALTHSDAALLVRVQGGRVTSQITLETTLLVIAEDGLLDGGGRIPLKLQRARELADAGSALQILAEEEFLRRLDRSDLQQSIHRRYTVAQLSRLLNIAPARIRRWIREGLLVPVERLHRLELFDYRQVLQIRRLAQLTDQQVPMARIRRSLAQLRQWLPQADQPLELLRTWDSQRRAMLVRTPDGRLAEAGGQLLFDFETASNGPSLIELDQWRGEAIHLEEQGEFTAAADRYRRLLKHQPQDPELMFHLGNALYAAGCVLEAREWFQRSVTRDPEFAEAWNNLGNLLAETGETAASVDALTRAVELRPDYADAHYNLANTLDELGRTGEAGRHWQTYLSYDQHSTWARYARQRLGELRAE